MSAIKRRGEGDQLPKRNSAKEKKTLLKHRACSLHPIQERAPGCGSQRENKKRGRSKQEKGGQRRERRGGLNCPHTQGLQERARGGTIPASS